jgi:hypothetical protein
MPYTAAEVQAFHALIRSGDQAAVQKQLQENPGHQV